MLQDTASDVKQSGYAILGDIGKQAVAHLAPVMPTLIPTLIDDMCASWRRSISACRAGVGVGVGVGVGGAVVVPALPAFAHVNSIDVRFGGDGGQ